MCGAKGSAPTPSAASTTTAGTSSGTSSSSFAQGPSPTSAVRYEDFLNAAGSLATTPFNPAMEASVAPLTDYQNQALQGMFTQGMDMGNFDPARVQAIESPYTQDVVNASQNWFNNQNAIQGNQLLGQGIRSGNAFGGDRMGVAAAEMAGQQQLAQAPVIAGLYQSGYTQALNEYNQLKQFGLTGAEEAMKAGTVQQAQTQREMDVAQQNAMMQSAYPFQLANWYGSALGGIGPLTGTVGAATTSTAANTTGISNPPTPNPLTQALGIGSTLFGLGSAIFGKEGGRVGPQGFERKARGGFIPDETGGDPLSFIQHQAPVAPPSNIAGNLDVPNYRKYYLQMANLTKGNVGGGRPVGGSGIPLAARGGPVHPRYLALGGSNHYQDGEEVDDDNNEDRPRQRYAAADTTVSDASMPAPSSVRVARGSVYGQAPGFVDRMDRPNSNALGVPESSQGIALPTRGTLGDYYNAWLPGKVPGRDMPELVRQTDTGPAPWTGRGIDYSAAASLRAGIRPQNFPTDQPIAYAPVTAMGSPPGLPELQERLPGGTDVGGDGAGETGLSRVIAERGPMSVRNIPGLAKPERSFGQRWAANPFTQAGIAMLQTRSPYFGEGLGAGLAGATGALNRQYAEDVLDAKPQMITSGPTIMARSGDRLIDFGIKTQTAAQEERNKRLQERERRISEAGGMASKADARARDSLLYRMEKDHYTALKAEPDWIGKPDAEVRAEARRRTVQRWNEMHPNQQMEPPAAPEKPAETEGEAVPPKKPGIVSRIGESLKEGAKNLYGDMTAPPPSSVATRPFVPVPAGPGAVGSFKRPDLTEPGTAVARPAPGPAPTETAPTGEKPAPAPEPAPAKQPPNIRQAIDSAKTPEEKKAMGERILSEAGQKLNALRDQVKRNTIFKRLRDAGLDPSSLMTPTDAGARVPR